MQAMGGESRLVNPAAIVGVAPALDDLLAAQPLAVGTLSDDLLQSL